MTDRITTFLNKLKSQPALLAFLSVAPLFLVTCLAFVTRWETNDDLTMSMIAHGYGLAAYGSPNLLYSNVIWGHIVRLIPSIHGVLGYSLATMATLFVIAWTMFYFLLRLGTGYLPGLLATVLMLARPTLFPQFTITAGLLTVSAVLGWQVHARFGDRRSLFIACLLAFFGSLIRIDISLLVLLVALPLLPWHSLRRERTMQIAVAVLALAITLAAFIDRTAYNSPGWKTLRELDPARAPFSDFLAGDRMEKRPEILTRHGYSKNDIELISNNFFVDMNLADPKTLRTMLEELGPLFLQKGSIALGFSSIKTLFALPLLSLFLCGLFLLGILPRKPAALAWGLCLFASFAIGMMGRPGFLRVYFPLLGLLLVAPLALGEIKKGARRWVITFALFAACAGNICYLAPLVSNAKFFMRQVRKDIQNLPDEVLYTWGGPSFPYELAFPVLSNDPEPRKMKLDPLYLFTYAPFSVAWAEQKAGRGLIQRLCSPEGAPIITSEKRTFLLGSYCLDRLNGHLQTALVYKTPTIVIEQLRCVTTGVTSLKGTSPVTGQGVAQK